MPMHNSQQWSVQNADKCTTAFVFANEKQQEWLRAVFSSAERQRTAWQPTCCESAVVTGRALCRYLGLSTYIHFVVLSRCFLVKMCVGLSCGTCGSCALSVKRYVSRIILYIQQG